MDVLHMVVYDLLNYRQEDLTTSRIYGQHGVVSWPFRGRYYDSPAILHTVRAWIRSPVTHRAYGACAYSFWIKGGRADGVYFMKQGRPDILHATYRFSMENTISNKVGSFLV